MAPTSTLTLPVPVLWSHRPSHLNAPPASVFLLGSAVFRDALGSQFGQHVVQVIGIWVAMAGEIRAKLCLVVHFIPDDGVRLARGAGGTDGKDEAAIPGHQKQLQNLWSNGKRGRADFSVGHTLSLGGKGPLRGPTLPASRSPK